VFQNEELKNHLETSFSIESQSAVVAEWNMNIPGNIFKLGNYRYRENNTAFAALPNSFDVNDFGGFYTGATDADIVVEFGTEEDGSTPQIFTYPKDKEKLLYSLEDCLKPFRPRSGINKLSYFSDKYLPFSNRDMYLRPRYYMPTKDDEFKYWRSYRTESNTDFLNPVEISPDATITTIEQDGQTWLGTITNMLSVADLKVGKKIYASAGDVISMSNSATISNVTNVTLPNISSTGIPNQYGVWTATISGLSSVAGVKVGDSIEATAGTGVLFGSTTKTGTINLSGQTEYIISVSEITGLAVGMTLTKVSGVGDLGNGAKIIQINPPAGGITTHSLIVRSSSVSTLGSITFKAVGTVSVLVSEILSSSSIKYQLTDITAPTQGDISAIKTVSSSFTYAVNDLNTLDMDVSVEEITGPSSIVARFVSGSAPKLGRLKNIFIKDYTLNNEFGISKNSTTGRYAIDDCNPFVVYKEPVPANRIVLKVQTNIGSIDLGPFKTSGNASLEDPFVGEANKTVPKKFKIQYLNSNNQWLDAYEFNETGLRDDEAAPVFNPDGYLSLEYGIQIPRQYRNSFSYVGQVQNEALLPEQNFIGTAYLIVSEQNPKGVLKIFNGFDYEEFAAVYRWFIGTDETYGSTHFVTDFTNPPSYNESGSTEKSYREFVWMKGLRVAVETMNTPNTPLELIEISPRLVANLSESLIGFDITKAASDLSGSALPVGQIMAGVGNVSLFDGDNSFNPNNEWDFEEETGSIIAKYINKNIKFTFYEVIKKVNNRDNYYVPIKTMYSESFPDRDARTGETTLSLRDFYFYFESLKAPRILITEASLSQAVCLLLDSVGFSNYVFKRLPSESDPVIPYFFIPPDQSVAETLESLARATQSAMFFDEFNNFVVMTKQYLLDESPERAVDVTLYGSNPKEDDNKRLPNIIAIESKDKQVYNSGTVNYTTRYIKRTGGSIAQSQFVDKSYIYNPSLLWEVGGEETTKSANDEKQDRFALSAVPLNTNLSSDVPLVTNDGIIINNTFDIGENAYWLARYQGFFYANGEIIRYDAVEYNVTGAGDVWISSNLEYQKYFSEIPFNGKIYPTGLIRIYSEPFYETITGTTISFNETSVAQAVRLKPGPVVSHGRGQFGTVVTGHLAGLDPYWSNNNNVRGCEMDSSLLFTTKLPEQRSIPATVVGATGLRKSVAEKSQRNGIIRNFLSSRFSNETNISSLKTTQSGTIQSSALVITGPDFEPSLTPRNFISYVHKKLDRAYKHFGTRVRILGKIESAGDRSQSVAGGMTYFTLPGTEASDTIAIGGGSAGIGLVNPETNIGYYFEISALTVSDIESLLKKENGTSTISLENILFYKLKKRKTGSSDLAIPIRLWGGIGNILVDEGNFVGQYRFTGDENPTVYDLAIEYVDISPTRRDFYLYINQTLVQTVVDNDPLPLINESVALTVRGSSKAMFENVYALSKNYATNTVFDVNTPIASIFGDSDSQVNATEALKRYAMSGVIQSTYLSGIKPNTVPDYLLYFEEFGTIFRECSYFNIKYDRAYPALYAKIAPTFSRVKGYTVSGFTADSYGAEFLVFNNTDTILNLDEKTGNYLRILGIAFTQDTTSSLTVDDYLKKRGNLSDPELSGSQVIESPFKFTEQYEKIRQSRILYGKNDFTLESIYIQDQDSAEDLLGWIIEKNIRPRKSVGLGIFSMPTLQLGDLVNIEYKDSEGIDLISPTTTKYVVYNINYSKSVGGPDMTVYLSEV
jgi:hypothetical protein